MACYHPIDAWRRRDGTVQFHAGNAIGFGFKIPCGQCIGCRLERSRQWAIRCMYEASLHQENCFITLTYDDEHLPADGGLRTSDFQKFMKRLRRRFSGRKISFFHCGEYGDLERRPHYHAILFGVDFQDRVLFSERQGVNTYTSDSLGSLWPLGFSTIGDVSFESCAYVARYVMKKVTGAGADRHYQRVIPETGEIVQVKPEYITMSLKPAIGKKWFEKFHSDVFPSDEAVVRGIAMKPPKYFERLFDVMDPELLEIIKLQRLKDAKPFKSEQTPERLAVRERVKCAQISMLKRSL